MQNTKTCTHIKISGVRCGSPSLRGTKFCYYHQRLHRGVLTPPESRLHPIAIIEDKDSIQAALMEVINALLRNTIDMKRAALILRALHIAVKNDARAGINAQPSHMVRDVPKYDEPTGSYASNGMPDLRVPFEAGFGQDPRASKPQRYYKTPEQFAKDRDESIANYYGYPTAEAYAAAKAAKSNAPPPSSPVSPVAKSASSPARNDPSTPGAASLPPHQFKKSPATQSAAQRSHASPASSTLNPPRKPAMPVKAAPASVSKGGA